MPKTKELRFDAWVYPSAIELLDKKTDLQKHRLVVFLSPQKDAVSATLTVDMPVPDKRITLTETNFRDVFRHIFGNHPLHPDAQNLCNDICKNLFGEESNA